MNLKAAVKWFVTSKQDNAVTLEHDHLLVSIRPDPADNVELFLGHLSSATRQDKAKAATRLDLIADIATEAMKASALDIHVEEQVSHQITL